MPSEKKAWDYLKEGAAYVCNPANTLREFRSLPRAAKGLFAFLLVGLVAYFAMVADYSFWGWLAIAGLVFSAINLVLVITASSRATRGASYVRYAPSSAL